MRLFGEIVECFALWLNSKGYTNITIRNKITDLYRIEKYLLRRGLSSIYELTEHLLHQCYLYIKKKYRQSKASTVTNLKNYINTNLFSFHSILDKTDLIENELQKYNLFLNEVCGYKKNTINVHYRHMRSFLAFIQFDKDTKNLNLCNINSIDRFVIKFFKKNSREHLQQMIGCLRKYLKYKYQNEDITESLHDKITSPKTIKATKLPKVIPDELINKLLMSINCTTQKGIRDYTILHLLSFYGLRSSEVLAITLDSIDWKKLEMKVYQVKSKRYLMLPITLEIKELLIHYLKNARNNETNYRELFLKTIAPIEPLRSVYSIFESVIKNSKIDISASGPHSLRHSFITRMILGHKTMKETADLVGHLSHSSTSEYLRLATADLMNIAMEAPTSDNDINLSSPIVIAPYASRKPPSRTEKIKQQHVKSFLFLEIEHYIEYKIALGKILKLEEKTLKSFNDFIYKYYNTSRDITCEVFNHWVSKTQSHLEKNTKHVRMSMIRKFLMFLKRSKQNTFVPDIGPAPRKKIKDNARLINELEINKILAATRSLYQIERNPLRSEVYYVAFLLLWSTGIRRGEILKLNISDIDLKNNTILIENTKFNKSRIVPITKSIADKVNEYLEKRKKHYDIEPSSPFLITYGNNNKINRLGRTSLYDTWRAICITLSILDSKGSPATVHSMRHSFIMNSLVSWYEKGSDINHMLPLLRTYVGHKDINSTYYYLQFIEELSGHVSQIFEHRIKDYHDE